MRDSTDEDRGGRLSPGPIRRPVEQSSIAAPALAARAEQLTELLRAHAPFWNRSPFHHPHPEWTQTHPGIVDALFALTDAEVRALTTDGAALVRWLAGHVPTLTALPALTEVPDIALPIRAADLGQRRFAHVPGRKAAQIAAFADAIDRLGPPTRPLVEWCAGKGHLGRLLHERAAVDVLSVEIDPTLCAEGRRLAARNGAEQRFECRDVLADPPAIGGRHVVALHACGDLSRTLLERADHQPPAALDVAPCCYAKTIHPRHVPLHAGTPDLALDPLALRLAVADQPAPEARDARRARRELVWKLAYMMLRTRFSEVPRSAPLLSTPRAWSRLDVESWCRAVAARDGVELPADGIDWHAALTEAQQALDRFNRLNLTRLAFRRAIELWIVLDQARWLDALGYRVRVGTFCPPEVTPRNLLVSGRAR